MPLRPLALAALTAAAAGHGSLIIPPARNNHQNVDPAKMFAHGSHAFGPPESGASPGIFNVTPAGSSGGGCCAGGACLWFSEGCFIGCDTCTGLMPAGGNQINKPPAGCTPAEPTLPAEYRTYNGKNLSANGDWTRYHPVRTAAPHQ